MATRAYVQIPEGGLKVRGMVFPAGPREINDDGWLRVLRSIEGVKMLDETEYLVLTQQAGDPEVKRRRRGKKK